MTEKEKMLCYVFIAFTDIRDGFYKVEWVFKVWKTTIINKWPYGSIFDYL
jgi:hypothetical protein